MSLCEGNCELKAYDNNNKKVKCSCNVKHTFFFDYKIDNKNLMKNLFDIKKNINRYWLTE